MKSLILAPILTVALASAAGAAENVQLARKTPAADGEPAAVDDGGTPPPVKKKKRAKKRQRHQSSDTDGTPQDPSDTSGEPTGERPDEAKNSSVGSAVGSAAARRSPLFPAWRRPGFDWSLGPVVGVRYASETNDAGTTRDSTVETGLHAGLQDIPLVPGNPGLGLEVGALQAWGATTLAATSDGKTATATSHYQRSLGSVGATGYFGWLREELRFSRGRLTYDDAAKTVVQSAGVGLDNGVLVLSWLSAHYSYDYLRAFTDRYGEPLVIQHDHWLHGRAFTDWLSFHVDFGPGFTQVTEYALQDTGSTSESAHGRSDYLKALTSLHLFWKLGASGAAKYIYAATSDEVGADAGTRLPEQNLSEQSPLALPEDSLQASFFIGASDVFYGLGLGWRYNLQILNVHGHGGRETVTAKDQGFGVTYAAAI